jgi:hypothetical protein
MNALAKCIAWLNPRDRRKKGRRDGLPLIAHYWDGGPPAPHRVRDISPHGLFLETEQRWYPGTFVMLTLQREDLPESDPCRNITVNARVVRFASDGVGFSIVSAEKTTSESGHHLRLGGADQKRFERFVASLLIDLTQFGK